MKISKREKIIILLLVMFIMGFVYFQYVYTPMTDKIDSLNQVHTQKSQELLAKKNKIKEIEALNKKIKEQKKAIQLISASFFPTVDQEELIDLIHHIAFQSSLTIDDIIFDEVLEEMKLPSIASIKDHPDANSALNLTSHQIDTIAGSQADSQTETGDGQEVEVTAPVEEDHFVTIGLLSANVNFKGTYAQFRDFLSQVDDYDKKIVIKKMNIDASSADAANKISLEDSQEVEGTFVLEFYMMDTSDLDEDLPDDEMIAHQDPSGQEGKDGMKQDTPSEPSTPKDDPGQSQTGENIFDLANAQRSIKQVEYPFFPLLANEERIADFSFGIENISLAKSHKEIKVSLNHQKDAGPNYKGGALLNYTFKERGKGFVALNLAKRNLIFSQDIERMGMNIYVENPGRQKMSFVFQDQKGGEYVVNILPDINFTGWRKVFVDKSQFAILKYPVRLKSVLIENTQNGVSNASIMFGDLSLIK